MNKLSVLIVAGLILACSSTGWAALVGYWSFDDSANPGHDDSGNGNDGTLYGPTWTTGKFGGALSFDGDDYVEVPDSSSLRSPTTAVSIEAWVKFFDTSVGHIVAKQYEGAGLPLEYQYDSYALWAIGGRLYFSVCDGEYLPTQPRVSAPISTNEWHRVLGVWDGSISTMLLYIDGQLKASDVFTGFKNIVYDDSPCLIGADDNGPHDIPSGFLNGVLDEVRIYNHVIPEPATLLLLGLGGLALLRKRKK